MQTFDAIVVGVGGIGSSALYHLAERGLKVLGLEQFEIAHDRGSSHGGTRICRKAYFEHPDYVPLLHRAYDAWRTLESQTGKTLFRRVGLLLVGPPKGAILPAIKRAATEHQLAIDAVDIAQLTDRFPGFAADADWEALFEQDAGFLYVEDCVRAYCEQAIARGATIVTRQTVRQWSRDGTGVRVRCDGLEYRAERLVICAGAWTSRILAELGLPLEVRRKVLVWLSDVDGVYAVGAGCPVFAFETLDGFFYGFPVLDDSGLKMGQHFGGEVVGDPDSPDRELHPSDVDPLARFVTRHLPAARPTIGKHSVCMYTMTPDEHFVLDRHPDHANVVFAAGFSGHGFKFAPVVGSVLADLVVDGRTDEPIGFLSASRAALRPV